jgi:aspartate carbamoyltransferase
MVVKFFDRVAKMEKPWAYNRDVNYMARGKVMCSWFGEDSTRTYVSFESAMAHMGGYTITPPVQHSSVNKGEVWEDTIKTLSQLCDIIVARTPRPGDAERAAAVASVPYINAGDAQNEHPTQALLDLYTIYKKYRTLDGLEIAFVGDMKHSRTSHSLLHLLNLFPNVTYHLVCPEGLFLDPREFLKRPDLHFKRHDSVEDLIAAKVHVVYMMRNQLERRLQAEKSKEFSYDPRKHSLNLTQTQRLPESSIILHPLPRGIELPQEVDLDHRAFYWKQVKNGLYVRMALIEQLLEETPAG